MTRLHSSRATNLICLWEILLVEREHSSLLREQPNWPACRKTIKKRAHLFFIYSHRLFHSFMSLILMLYSSFLVSFGDNTCGAHAFWIDLHIFFTKNIHFHIKYIKEHKRFQVCPFNPLMHWRFKPPPPKKKKCPVGW